MDSTPVSQQDRALQLETLARLLAENWMKIEIDSLYEAVDLAREAVQITSDVDLEWPTRVISLGDLLFKRSIRLDRADDLKEALRCYYSALSNDTISVPSYIEAGKMVLIILESSSNWEELFRISRNLVYHIPGLVSHGLENSDKQRALSQSVGIASQAAAAALMVSEGPVMALQLLECTRGLISTSIDQARVDIGEFLEGRPGLTDMGVL
ncbi:hypothetical protein SUNI508_04215 [Seiridium unicorne]|uniref:Uncharacterized protein n=1 Tax=Seiridium unicorne TaxID=138068 RepID=A0ABR2V984_9PEZI